MILLRRREPRRTYVRRIEREFIALASDPDAVEVSPEDGSQKVIINKERLNEVRKVYRSKFGRDFQPNFLLRHLQGARRGMKSARRDPDLLEAVKVFLASKSGQLHGLHLDLKRILSRCGDRSDRAQSRGRNRAPSPQVRLRPRILGTSCGFVAQLRMAASLEQEHRDRQNR